MIKEMEKIEEKLKKSESLFVDTDHDSINFKKIVNWAFLTILGGMWWFSLFTKGLGVTMIWTVVVVALYALWYVMRDMRI